MLKITQGNLECNLLHNENVPTEVCLNITFVARFGSLNAVLHKYNTNFNFQINSQEYSIKH